MTNPINVARVGTLFDGPRRREAAALSDYTRQR
jgi:hypothetical protein